MNNLDIFPRLLIVSNCCLSNSTSNGRTLKNFLIGWPKDKLAQFCIHFDDPDYSMCSNYYRVSDRDALNAFKLKGVKSGVVDPEQNRIAENSRNVTSTNSSDEKKVGRNAFSAYIREIVWDSKKWKGDYFDNWIKEFNPEVVLLQAGDNGFLCRICLEISNMYNIPIVIYNSESYYFKNFDHMRSSGWKKLFFPIFKRRFRKDFKRLMAKAHSAIYCCDMLTEDYRMVFDTPGVTIYTATEVKPCDKSDVAPHTFKISYLGNLGVGRSDGLITIANALQSISPDLRLDIYGKIHNDSIKNAFDSCPGINYKGFVSYDQVKDVMRDSDVLVHTENFSDYYRKDLKYAFSTKIADSLASGTCFLLYAPAEIAASQYLIRNNAAYVVSDENELKEMLERLINDPESRNKYLTKAKELVETNHVYSKNSKTFQKILKDAVSGE